MNDQQALTVKIADCPEEMEQIYQLNYETFVEEIPQHKVNENRQLVDKFHAENTYIIAKDGEDVVAMVAVRGNRPFSLDHKLGSIDPYLPDGAKPCEVRLLAMKKAYRGSRTLYRLFQRLVAYCVSEGYNMALISGTDRQTRLYRHLGFEPFGPPVGTDAARFQPMMLTVGQFESATRLFGNLLKREKSAVSCSFLPGPVPVVREVREAWAQPPMSHRSNAFRKKMDETKEQLCRFTGANHAEIIVGTGTLANEVVAAQLSLLPGKGLILANGEFGERLIGQAKRWELSFAAIRKPWCNPVDLAEVEELLAVYPPIQWVWTVHSETSTGYVYPLHELKELCRQRSVHLCLDACSSVGVLPVDLSDVYLATAVSGKGLGSYPGLAVVFHQMAAAPNEQLPAYLDLGKYAVTGSIPFTHSSNGVHALNEAVMHHTYPADELAEQVTRILREAGMNVLWKSGYSPGIITAELPEQLSSQLFGDRLAEGGIFISYESAYLLERNWIQLALMGTQKKREVLVGVRFVAEQFKKLLPKEQSGPLIPEEQ